jgi:hypothetical protein
MFLFVLLYFLISIFKFFHICNAITIFILLYSIFKIIYKDIYMSGWGNQGQGQQGWGQQGQGGWGQD